MPCKGYDEIYYAFMALSWENLVILTVCKAGRGFLCCAGALRGLSSMLQGVLEKGANIPAMRVFVLPITQFTQVACFHCCYFASIAPEG